MVGQTSTECVVALMVGYGGGDGYRLRFGGGSDGTAVMQIGLMFSMSNGEYSRSTSALHCFDIPVFGCATLPWVELLGFLVRAIPNGRNVEIKRRYDN